ncbi:hypothetical protein GCM10027321_45390 [Massilia terrae]|uniref:Glucosamine inositolphosphorylceramide transferase 1 N-terminal domain-containing protein n=1 Tax=Massilia terrae TaxID=1811224 RepID=A0ABT2CYF0_9BURK|nr:hypothetical protein [Massilia terrae]MCS0659004.1 hypothetical protein [Massilia terrae]
MRKLRMGIVLDSPLTNVYVASFFQWAARQDVLELVVAIRLPAPAAADARAPRRSIRAWAFECVMWSEQHLLKFYSAHRQHLSVVDLERGNVLGPAGLPMMTLQRDGGPDDAGWRQLTDLGIDILLNFSSAALPSALLALSRLGALGIGYHERPMLPTVCAGFWESYHRQARTQFSIRSADAAASGERLLLQGAFRTQFSFLLNQAHLYRKSLAQLERILLSVALSGALPPPRPALPETGPFATLPHAGQALVYLAKVAARLSGKAIGRALNIRQTWALQITISDWRKAKAENGIRISAPVGHFWADPFLLADSGRTYCFVEDYLYSTKRAHISVLELIEKKLVPIGVALQETFHLSFPFLFKYRGEIYMCPEASESRQIRVYKATAFPLQWELCSIAMRDISAADSMFFEHGGRWWLLTSLDRAGLKDHCSELCLFSASSPLDTTWTPHPANPLYVDACCGRNAGLILDKGKIFRAAQMQGFDQYGEAVGLYEIIRLDDTHYEEVKVTDLKRVRPSRALGSHHISTTGRVTVVDYLTRRFAP